MAVFEQCLKKFHRFFIVPVLISICLAGGVITPAPAQPATDAIAVLYPDILQFKEVFLDIIRGIESSSRHKMIPYAVTSEFNQDEFLSWIHALNIKVIIAIGNTGTKATEAVKGKIPVINNTFLVPNNENGHISGISLAVDPAPLFNHLTSLAPGVKRINVVYNPEISGWLIKIAQLPAKKHGLELIAYEAVDLKSAARLYSKILEQGIPHEDAIWLPQDKTTVNDNVILPMVLKEAWDRSLVVFSSIGAHAKNGVLFSLYPDNYKLGRSLGDMANGYLDINSKPLLRIEPLKDIQIAVNIRTAEHLGLDLRKNINRFDLVFPAPKE